MTLGTRPFQNTWGDHEIHPSVRVAAFVDIGDDVSIGEGSSIQAFVSLCPGVRLGKRVFIGPHVAFTNDKNPHAVGDWEMLETFVEDDVAIGANATILPGIRIGKGATIGAGSVVTKDVPAGVTVVGNPARVL